MPVEALWRWGLLRRDCRERLGQLRTALDQPLPPHARAQIERLLDRLDLVRKQVAELEAQRDQAVVGETAGQAEQMIQRLARVRGIGCPDRDRAGPRGLRAPVPQRPRLSSYAGLTGTS